MALWSLLFLLAALLLVSSKGTETVPAAVPKPAIPALKPPTPAPAPALKPPTVAPRPPIKTLADCRPQCSGRCLVHSRPNVCLRACNTCCQRCRCVPPGTAGNKEVCGKCYATMTTTGGKLKCP